MDDKYRSDKYILFLSQKTHKSTKSTEELRSCLTFANMDTKTNKRFTDFEYVRPDMETLPKAFNIAVDQFKKANDFSSAKEALHKVYQLRSGFDSMYNLAYIRHSINTKDVFYEKENDFFDQQLPLFEKLKTEWYKELLASPFRKDLEDCFGKQLFDIAQLSLKTFHPDIIEDLQEENSLSSAYNKLKATAQITFEGETYNLSSIIPKEQDIDRNVREAASKTKWDWLAGQQIEMERIFDELVKIRHKIACKLGFENFIELGYARMLRTDYNANDVKYYRDQIHQHFVPLASKLYDQQRERLGVDELKNFDESLLFLNGNPQPKGDPQWIIDKADQMYGELSEETKEFFTFMQDNELMDLVSRDGKSTGGYCTFMSEFKAPFIFSNFNGTSGDIDVLTHEAGHAFQIYSSKDLEISEYHWPTYEACEIHSMSMEFFTWPWMELFFEEKVEDYRMAHLTGAVYFLPYGVAVDEFQHYVYENPMVTPAERNQAWKKIEEKYLPQRNYNGHAYLESGGFWQKQTHIFGMPFYYIDYTLAQICAFQFWIKDRQDHDSAWSDYVDLCKAGGSQSFLSLVKLANLESPFEKGTVEKLVKEVEKFLSNRKA